MDAGRPLLAVWGRYGSVGFLHPRLCQHPQHALRCSDALLPWRPLIDFLGLRTEETVLGYWEDRVTSWSSPQASTTCQSFALDCTAGKQRLRVVLSGSGPGQTLEAVKENCSCLPSSTCSVGVESAVAQLKGQQGATVAWTFGACVCHMSPTVSVAFRIANTPHHGICSAHVPSRARHIHWLVLIPNSCWRWGLHHSHVIDEEMEA